MKSMHQSWNDYINCNDLKSAYQKEHQQVSREYEKIRHEYDKNMSALSNKWGAYFRAFSAPTYKSSTKIIVKKPTAKFPGHEKYPKYTFYWQCQMTGNLSRAIKLEDYPQYGIFMQDADNPPPEIYPDPNPKVDRVKKFMEFYYKEWSRISKEWLEYCRRSNWPDYPDTHWEWMNRYNEYLESDEWSRVRSRIINIDNHNCLHCGVDSKSSILQVHHITYVNVGRENDDELMTLCKDCHQTLHESSYEVRQSMEEDAMIMRSGCMEP